MWGHLTVIAAGLWLWGQAIPSTVTYWEQTTLQLQHEVQLFQQVQRCGARWANLRNITASQELLRTLYEPAPVAELAHSFTTALAFPTEDLQPPCQAGGWEIALHREDNPRYPSAWPNWVPRLRRVP